MKSDEESPKRALPPGGRAGRGTSHHTPTGVHLASVAGIAVNKERQARAVKE